MQTCLLKTEENKSRQLTLVRMLSNNELIMMLKKPIQPEVSGIC